MNKKNFQYWRDRENEWYKMMYENDKRIASALTANTLNAKKEIEDKINSFYVKYAKSESIELEEALKRVNALDVRAFENKAAEYVKNLDFSKRANAELKLYNLKMKVNRLELLKHEIDIELVRLGAENENAIRTNLKEQIIKEFERQAGILGKGVKGSTERAAVIADSSFKNAQWSTRLWANQKALRIELNKLLDRSIRRGVNPKVIARDLKKKFDRTTYEAERIARTESTRVQIQAKKETFERNGIEKFQFYNPMDAKTSQVCADMNGTVFKVSEIRYGDNAPPLHPHCRSSIMPVTE